jgi:ubiquinone/menaquinone biosynthesis C-methylase UbiE
MSLVQHKQDWESLGEMDPLWAVLTMPDKKFGRWKLDEFFARGRWEIERALEIAGPFGYPVGRTSALDFGCGVGRLTRALAAHFDTCVGVDIAASMVHRAQELNQDVPACKFVVNDAADLRMFDDDSFDMIFTSQVLMHMPSRSVIRSYISEFVRTLRKDGLLVFQLLHHAPLLDRLQPRRRIYGQLKALGVSQTLLYRHLGLTPIKINFIPEQQVLEQLRQLGARVLDVQGYSVPAMLPGTARHSRTYYVTR